MNTAESRRDTRTEADAQGIRQLKQFCALLSARFQQMLDASAAEAAAEAKSI